MKKLKNNLCILWMVLFPAVLYLFPEIRKRLYDIPEKAKLLSFINDIAPFVYVAAVIIIIVASIRLQRHIDLSKNKLIFITAILAKLSFIKIYGTYLIIILLIIGACANPFLMVADLFLVPMAIPILILMITILSGIISIPAASRVICFAREKKMHIAVCIIHCIALFIPIAGIIDCLILCVTEVAIQKKISAEPIIAE